MKIKSTENTNSTQKKHRFFLPQQDLSTFWKYEKFNHAEQLSSTAKSIKQG